MPLHLSSLPDLRSSLKDMEEQKLEDKTYSRINIPMWLGVMIVVGWTLVLLIALTTFPQDGLGGLFQSFFRIGSIIYGGGQASKRCNIEALQGVLKLHRIRHFHDLLLSSTLLPSCLPCFSLE